VPRLLQISAARWVGFCFRELKCRSTADKGKGKGSSLDIAPLTILNSGALQPRKWQLTTVPRRTGTQWQPKARANGLLGPQYTVADISYQFHIIEQFFK